MPDEGEHPADDDNDGNDGNNEGGVPTQQAEQPGTDWCNDMSAGTHIFQIILHC